MAPAIAGCGAHDHVRLGTEVDPNAAHEHMRAGVVPPPFRNLEIALATPSREG